MEDVLFFIVTSKISEGAIFKYVHKNSHAGRGRGINHRKLEQQKEMFQNVLNL